MMQKIVVFLQISTILLSILAPSICRAKIQLSSAQKEKVVRREGFIQGVAIGLISTGAVSAGLSSLSFLSSTDYIGSGEFSFFRGGVHLAAGSLVALVGLASITGGAYLSREYSLRYPSDLKYRSKWMASRLKGMALMLAIQGLVSTTIAMPFLLLSDEHLNDLTGNTRLSRIAGKVNIVIGGAHLLTALTLGLIGYLWDTRSLDCFAFTPVLDPKTAMLRMSLAF